MSDILPIKVSNNIEPFDSWPDICKSPAVFFNEIAKRLYVDVDVNSIGSNVIISPSIPKAEDRGKLWIKTSWPYGIGIVSNGEYNMDYGMCGYPVNVPFLHKEISVKPSHLEVIGSVTLDEYGMKDLDTKGTGRFLWYMFTPPKIIL